MITFNELSNANSVRQREWDSSSDLTLLYFSNAMAGEAGEVCNVVKKLEREALGLRGSRASLEDLADEIADVIIYADLLAQKAGLNLGLAVQKKFNKTSIKYNLQTKIV